MKIQTNFYAKIKTDSCIGCGICVKKCPVSAITLKEEKGKKTAVVDMNKCFGCGVCTRFCPKKTIVMERRKETAFVPKDGFERYIFTAINNGKLQNLIFDNYSLWTNEAMRRLLGFILTLKPVKRKLATQQLKSRFINRLSKNYYTLAKVFIDMKKPNYSHPELKKKN